MTSISPDRNTVYDYDLSTLSNIRLNNRRAKQKLSYNVLHEPKLSELNHSNHVSHKDRLGFNNDHDTTDSIKIFKDAPSITSASLKNYTSHDNYKRYSPLKPKLNNFDIDSSLLERDNLRYLDKDLYSKGSRLNELKRERFLDTIISANNTKPTQYQKIYEDYDDKPLKESPMYEDLGFRPRNKDIRIPSLKPGNYFQKDSQPRKSPIKPVKAYAQQPNYYNRIQNKNKSLDLLEHQSEEQLKNYDQRFQHLVEKYQLDELSKSHSSVKDGDKNENGFVVDIEDKLESYKLMVEKLQAQARYEHSKNQELHDKIADCNRFIEFLEANFDNLYKKFSVVKLEKHDLHKKNQELIFINNYHESLSKKKDHGTKNRSITDTLCDAEISDDNSTTQLLINFNSIRINEDFKKLHSLKKFRVLAFAILALIRLQHRAQHRQAYVKKIHTLMGIA